MIAIIITKHNIAHAEKETLLDLAMLAHQLILQLLFNQWTKFKSPCGNIATSLQSIIIIYVPSV